ncbi:hypothetical protein F7725_010812 [Dissostichus mawsoni]|uniref:Uncharacterized protein n=1 Tax=Dissostichus mawsoni TaxID=36200 RepID=A0A7J5Z8X6_DISMA|nr:hypothetical protein F7725_010812 [Dissostichus mawsoni]
MKSSRSGLSVHRLLKEVIQRRSVSRTLNTTVFMKRSRSPSTVRDTSSDAAEAGGQTHLLLKLILEFVVGRLGLFL